MSYRTYINDTQVFGNNECYPEWISFIKSQGIEVDGDDDYDGYITDLQGIFNVIEKITREHIRARHNLISKGLLDTAELTDLSGSEWLDEEESLLNHNIDLIHNAYCFLPYQVFNAIKDVVDELQRPLNTSFKEWYRFPYKLKEGKKIHVHAG